MSWYTFISFEKKVKVKFVQYQDTGFWSWCDWCGKNKNRCPRSTEFQQNPPCPARTDSLHWGAAALSPWHPSGITWPWPCKKTDGHGDTHHHLQACFFNDFYMATQTNRKQRNTWKQLKEIFSRRKIRKHQKDEVDWTSQVATALKSTTFNFFRYSKHFWAFFEG